MNGNGPSHAHGDARRVKAPRAARAEALGLKLGPERRCVDEASIVDLLLTLGWADVVAKGDRTRAEGEARQTLDRLVGLGLGFRPSASGGRGFDPAEVANFLQWAGLERGDRFWRERCVPSGRRFVWAAHGLEPGAEAQPPPPTALGPRRFKVRFRRLFNLQGVEPGALTRLRLPLPLEDAALGELEIKLLPCQEVEAAYTIAEGRLDARLKVPAGRSVELGFEASFTAYPSGGEPSSAPLDARDAALYTRSNEGFIKLGKPIRRLAAEIADGEPDPWSRVARFWNFIFDRLNISMVNYDEIDPSRPNEWTVENGWCDCQLASALLVSLCRATGIPARMISGYVMDENTPYHHYWVEAWIDGRGWAPLDVLSWYFSTGGREPQWRDYYFGRLDYRMKTEQLPRLFNGPGSIRFPSAWYRLSKITGGGLEFGFYARDGGALIYRDHVAILGDDKGAARPIPRA